MSEKLPKFNRLRLEGNFFAWHVEVKTYFESLGMWDHVLEGAEIVVGEEEDETDAEKAAANCRRIILHSLHQEVHPAILHLNHANDMYLRLKKLFVGTPTAVIRGLREKLEGVRFQGNYCEYLTDYANTKEGY